MTGRVVMDGARTHRLLVRVETDRPGFAIGVVYVDQDCLKILLKKRIELQ